MEAGPTSAYIAVAATNHLIAPLRNLFHSGQVESVSFQCSPHKNPEAKASSKTAKLSPPNRKSDLDRSRYCSIISFRATPTVQISSIPSVSAADTPERQRQSQRSCPYHLRTVQSVSQVGRCSSIEPCRALLQPNQYRKLS